MSNITVIGATSWGATLATVLAKSGHAVRIWSRDAQEHQIFIKQGPFIQDLKNPFKFHKNITPTLNMAEAMYESNVVIIAVPSQTMRDNARAMACFLTDNMLIISASKGLEDGSHKRMTEVIREELPPALRNNVMALSGPNIAREIMDGMPSVTVVASENREKAVLAHDILSTDNLFIYTNTDMIGTELGGALKNIIALGAGIVDG
ncbi:MAG: NAD(P)-binding domain-containing protein, partial [Chloroflexi bacterium]|nr:NAD(P)-binding domain-containing protein [Chloroflexota bacterium]